ncbi:hypothetical protein [Paenibacillus flagellatus]|uniref:Uncharacterized protein n=1 Tax=Paenibacillus flagellatus TaxID=2211139 RepID=A0A2V5KB34_9BACL|nr:hypothetical protein [Paenibacillus flagellatus]PYI51060.1 hypothetical protein DLM86_27230 [Paenibacillus flagellatus]
MRLFWWTLPGPADFLAKVADDLKYGNQVCLMLPVTFPWNLKAYVRELIPDGGGWDWQSLRLDEFGEDARNPAALLYGIYLPRTKPSVVRDAASLLREEEFYGKVVWLEGMTSELWPVWKTFLEDYAALSRKIDAYDQTRFVVTLTGDLTEDPPKPDMGLAIHEWRGTMDKLDMRLYCSGQIRNRPESRVKKALLVELSAHLAQWDLLLAEQLSYEELEELVEPRALLLDYARQFEWEASASSWSQGSANVLEDRISIHSAFMTLSGDHAGVRRRVWEAQLAVLFPLIEEWRLTLIDFLRPVLTVPFQVDNRWVHDAYAMEINHVDYQIRDSALVDAGLKNCVKYLKIIRNRLAHLKPLTRADLHWIDAFDALPGLLVEEKRPVLPAPVSAASSAASDGAGADGSGEAAAVRDASA